MQKHCSPLSVYIVIIEQHHVKRQRRISFYFGFLIIVI